MSGLTHRCSCGEFACAQDWTALDPETEEQRTWPVEARAEACVFHCAKRPWGLCRGIVDALGVTEADLHAAGWRPCSTCGAATRLDSDCLVCCPPGHPRVSLGDGSTLQQI